MGVEPDPVTIPAGPIRADRAQPGLPGVEMRAGQSRHHDHAAGLDRFVDIGPVFPDEDGRTVVSLCCCGQKTLAPLLNLKAPF
jgi:hypothetical protein